MCSCSITSFLPLQVFRRLHGRDVHGVNDVDGVPSVRVVHVVHLDDLGGDELDLDDSAVVNHVLVPVLTPSAKRDDLAFMEGSVGGWDASSAWHGAHVLRWG